jgi:hypothetical protein
VLASARAAVPGPRAIFVHIKVEGTDGEQGAAGEGQEATGGKRDEAGKKEEEEEEEEEENEEKADEGQQREQHTQAPGDSFERRIEAGAGAVAPPRRARPPPGTYADTAVDYDEEEEEDDKDEEEECGGDEEEAEPRDPRAQESGTSIKRGSEAVRPQRLVPEARLDPGSLQARLRAPRRVAVNAI